jgi:tyrosyl-tRNA synthetase
MSISDELMWRYFDLASSKSFREVSNFKEQINSGVNPRDIKFILAQDIVARFHGLHAANQAQQDFIEQFQKGQTPDNIPEMQVSLTSDSIAIANLLQQAGLVASVSEGNRLVEQGGVKVNNEKVSRECKLHKNQSYLIQAGKRKYLNVDLR